MKEKVIHNLSYLIILLMLLSVCFWMWSNLTVDVSSYASSEDGTWDLKEIDFTKENVRLSGAVEYIPNALLTPEEFDACQEEAVFVKSFTTDKYMTTRIKILVPDGWYTLTRVSIDFSHRLYVNGELLAEVGSPGESADIDEPDTRSLIITVQAVDGVIEIVQQSSNYVHREGGVYRDWTIGGEDLGRSALASGYVVNIEMGLYLGLFLIFLLLYWMLPSYRASLYFALFCFTWFLRTGVIANKVFSVLVPWLNWYAKFRLEYISLPISAVLMILVVRSLFPGILQKIAICIIIAVSGVFVLLFLYLDTFSLSQLMPIFEGMCIIAIVYILVRFCTKLRRIRLEQGVLLMGVGLFFYTFVRDAFYYNNIYILPPFTGRELSQISMLLLTQFAAAAVFFTTMREVTAAKEAEQRLTAENTALDKMNELKSEWMQTISHEARTPLSVLASYAGLVSIELRQTGVDMQTAADLDTIIIEARRVADLIDSLKRAAMGIDESPEYIPVDLGLLTRQTALLYAPILERQCVCLVQDIAEELPQVFGSPRELSQVLFNLLQNARNYTEQGQIHISVSEKETHIVVTVADTGCGIAPELLPHVTERGIHGDAEKGSGLGLFLCKEIITAHGGSITIESQISQGTAVTFSIPVWKEEE